MARTIHLQSDSNAHDRPWRVAVEQGFFAEEGLEVVYHEDNPKGAEGRVKDFAQRWKETQLQRGRARGLSRVRMGRDRARAAARQGQDHRARHHRAHGRDHGAQVLRVQTLADLRNVPIAVTWHAGTFYAAIEVMEAAGVPFGEIRLEHASDRLDALLSGRNEAAALMEPLVSRAAAAGRKIADLRWRGGIVAGEDVDEETAEVAPRPQPRRRMARRKRRALARRTPARPPEQRKSGLLPELTGVKSYQPAEFKQKVDWMLERGFLAAPPAYDDIVRSK